MTMLLQTGVKKTNHFHIGTIFFSSFSQHKCRKTTRTETIQSFVLYCTEIKWQYTRNTYSNY